MSVPITYFRNYPDPFYPDWAFEPVPGWGVRPVAVGPARLGVGAAEASYTAVGQLVPTAAAVKKFDPSLIRKAPPTEAAPTAGERRLPRWAWGAIALVTVAAAAGVYMEVRR